jgi:hypothetical protein
MQIFGASLTRIVSTFSWLVKFYIIPFITPNLANYMVLRDILGLHNMVCSASKIIAKIICLTGVFLCVKIWRGRCVGVLTHQYGLGGASKKPGIASRLPKIINPLGVVD